MVFLQQATIGLVFLGIGYALFSVFIQRRLSNVDKMYELRATMSDKTKKLMALAKSNAPKEQMAQHQKELTDISMQSMKNQMKPMIVILPVLAILEYAVLPGIFPSTFTFSLLGFSLTYQMFFIVVIFIVGLVLSISMSMYDRRRLKDKYNFGLLQPSHKQQPEDSSAVV
jgi:uncharacterized membrane protein (DUF106 family)